MVSSSHKQTEHGSLPKDWDERHIHQFADIKTGPFGTLLKASEYAEHDGVPLISVGEIRDGYLSVSDTTPRVSNSVTQRLPEYVLREGDIVFARKGAVERSALIRREHDGWFLGSDGIRVRPSDDYQATYLAYQFQSSGIQNWLRKNAIGTTMPSLNQEVLRGVVVPLPPTRAEQKAIADALSDIDALIEALERLLAKKRHLKKGAMQELLSGKKRLPGFSDAWEVKRLGEICQVAIGRTPPRLNPQFWGRGHTWLSIADLRSKVATDSKEEITALAAVDMQVVREGTLLMSFKLSIGRLCFAGRDLYTNEAICSFNEPRANPEFLYYILGRTDFSLYGTLAVKGYTLNSASLRQIEVRLPSADEQTTISAILSDMDADIAALATKLDKARQLKQGMMQELLTGRTRLA